MIKQQLCIAPSVNPYALSDQEYCDRFNLLETAKLSADERRRQQKEVIEFVLRMRTT